MAGNTKPKVYGCRPHKVEPVIRTRLAAPDRRGATMDPVTEQTQQPRPLADRSSEELAAFLEEQQSAYRALEERGLKLDLTRGKPSTAQLDLSDTCSFFRLPDVVADLTSRRARGT